MATHPAPGPSRLRSVVSGSGPPANPGRKGCRVAETKRPMTGLFYILFFWLAGNALSLATGGYVSGNIIGMILLFASLCLRWVPADRVRPAARFLLGSMALFFVPYGVGLMVSYRVILENLWAILVSGVISTGLVIFVAGKTFQSLTRRARMRHIRHMRHAE